MLTLSGAIYLFTYSNFERYRWGAPPGVTKTYDDDSLCAISQVFSIIIGPRPDASRRAIS